jgi:hypothetical protein
MRILKWKKISELIHQIKQTLTRISFTYRGQSACLRHGVFTANPRNPPSFQLRIISTPPCCQNIAPKRKQRAFPCTILQSQNNQAFLNQRYSLIHLE